MNGEHMDSGPCRDCGECALPGPDQGLDPCLGLLPGVSQACCGHGAVDEAYVTIGGGPGLDSTAISHGVTLRGQNALTFFELVRSAPERWHPGQPWSPLAVIDGEPVEVKAYGKVVEVKVTQADELEVEATKAAPKRKRKSTRKPKA